ncbi:DNA repair protein, partial [Pseudomonas palleroniana]
PQDYQAQRLEVHKEVAEMAGMEWAEYCELHGLKLQD